MEHKNLRPGAPERNAHHRWTPVFGSTLMLLLLLFASGCQTTEKAISIDEARQISLEFSNRSFTPPPRTISDLEKELRVYTGGAECDPSPVEILSRQQVLDTLGGGGFYTTEPWCKAKKFFRRAEFLVSMGHFAEAIDYINMAINEFPSYSVMYLPKAAMCYAYLGDFTAAWLRAGSSNAGNMSEQTRIRTRRNYYASQAAIHQIQGQYRIAEANIRKAIAVSESAHGIAPSERIFELLIERIELAEILMLQGRLLEAEVALRDVMAHPLSREPVRKSRAALILSRIYFEQGRYRDAEQVATTSVAAFIASEAHCSSLYLNMARHVIARARTALGEWQAALDEFDAIRAAMAVQPELFHIRFEGDPDWIMALIGARRLDEAGKMTALALQKNTDLFSQDHYARAELQGLAAVIDVLKGDERSALKIFATCTPAMIAQQGQPGADTGGAMALNQRRAFILEYYMGLLADIHAGRIPATATSKPVEEAFRLAEAIRGSSVKQAVGALSARMASGNPELADLVRREQDAGKQISALRSVLFNALSQPEKNYDVINDLNVSISDLSAAEKAIRIEIENRFPEYANMTHPKPTKIDAIQADLEDNEAMIAFYVGASRTFVWAIPGSGQAAFAAVTEGQKVVDQRVRHIRKALAPESGSLDELPAFDTAAAHDFYQRFLAPVKKGWQAARHLSVVPHGPIGYLPLGLLPTGKAALEKDPRLFMAEYRSVPWLIRDHSITVVPSADVLITLRRMPPGKTDRRAFAGIGDPLFNRKQAIVQETTTSRSMTRSAGAGSENHIALHTRAIRITEGTTIDDGNLNTVRLDMLQPLPDTRDEVLSIASVLGANPDKDIFLGKEASEKRVKNTDLSDRRILVFATHGLVPGDLDGLNEPALALSLPSLADDEENDGLLTMGEIMGLRLDADWVVLSACNTAAGEGAGAEAASGLGRAFFYAGTRAILLSNWPVESYSVRLLTTDLFKRQAETPLLSRDRALQASMLNLLDKGVYKDPQTGKPLFAYAHPIFWAPFSLVGDGSGAADAAR
ncbi:MAG: CHAT domain-containing protein [Desulfobacterales bacterium]|nr:CHAT domain-containing protein [Desulfobacterales bacterium]